jgi:hypothetical protein
VREDNEREIGCHDNYYVGEEDESGFMRRYKETKDYTPMSTYHSSVGDELP